MDGFTAVNIDAKDALSLPTTTVFADMCSVLTSVSITYGIENTVCISFTVKLDPLL